MSELRRLASKPADALDAGARAGLLCTSLRPRVAFAAEATTCRCGADLHVHKTRTRTVFTLAYGGFVAREIVKHCGATPGVCPTVGSTGLPRLVKPGHRYGYDLIVYAGLARYFHIRQREEIRTELRQRGIELAAGTVSDLCDQFLVYLETLHVHRAPALRGAMTTGYPLHLDGHL